MFAKEKNIQDPTPAEDQGPADPGAAAENITEEIKEEIDAAQRLQQEVGELKDKWMRLYSEFDNYKRRTARERIELSRTAAQDLVATLLPVLDDFDRAMASMDAAADAAALQEGVKLIYSKFRGILLQRGLEEIPAAAGSPFDTDLHEAITTIPSATEEQKGKVVDVVEKGYSLHGKVIRHAKVVVGQ